MMDFLKSIFDTGPAPTVLPGAPAQTPSKGADVASLLARLLGATSAGFAGAQGLPPPQMPSFDKKRSDNMGMLMKRIFGDTNAPMAAGPKPLTTQIPTSAPQIGTGTGGLY